MRIYERASFLLERKYDRIIKFGDVHIYIYFGFGIKYCKLIRSSFISPQHNRI